MIMNMIVVLDEKRCWKAEEYNNIMLPCDTF